MSVAYLGFIPAKSRTEHPKEWQPLKTNKNCVRYGRKATYYFPTCQLNEFARINVKQTYYLILQTGQTTTSLKRNPFRREEVRNNRMSAALSYVYVFIKKMNYSLFDKNQQRQLNLAIREQKITHYWKITSISIKSRVLKKTK